jgi:hypothetical protein
MLPDEKISDHDHVKSVKNIGLELSLERISGDSSAA